jgi:hypothetical protein
MDFFISVLSNIKMCIPVAESKTVEGRLGTDRLNRYVHLILKIVMEFKVDKHCNKI